jgi:alpha-tubulin suppressor-like RCC1 family protein
VTAKWARLLLGASLIAACDVSYEVLTYQLDAGSGSAGTIAQPAGCDCAEQEVCVNRTCIGLSELGLLAAGDRHTCRIAQGQLWCFGDNSSDQLGLAADAPDVVATPQRVGSRSDWQTVAAGSLHTCALRSPGVLRCWGDDSQGQLGSSSGRSRDEQPRVPWEDFRQLKCGGDNCCALRSGGALYCWGANRDGSAGIDSSDTTPIDVPTQIGGEQTFSRAYSVGKTHSCAIAVDRTLWCWGSNAANQLGTPGIDRQLAPQQVGEDADWLWVAAGGAQTCGIRGQNELYCWGDNSDGQVGIERVGPDGELVVPEKPVIVTSTMDWVRVGVGDKHGCGIKRDQPLYCWGRNDSGQLAMSDASAVVESPTRTDSMLRFREVALGAAHSCALEVTNPPFALYCWGNNERGQLGTGDTSARTEPTRVELN